MSAKSNSSPFILKVILGISGLLSVGFWYIIVRYVHFDFSTFKNIIKSFSVLYLGIGATLLFGFTLFLLRTKSAQLKKYSSSLAKLGIQILILLYIANFGVLITLINAQTTCLTARDVVNSNYCLLLLKPTNATVYRALNPQNKTSSAANPSNHQGHLCQTNGTTPGSVVIYDASPDFYGSSGSAWQSIHRSVINFTTGLSTSGKISLDAPLCATVIVSARDTNNFVTLMDPATPSPTPVPTATATVRPTVTASPTPTATIRPTVTASPTPVPTATATVRPTATASPTPTATVRPTVTASPTLRPTTTATARPTIKASSTPRPHDDDDDDNPRSTARATQTPRVTIRPTSTPRSDDDDRNHGLLWYWYRRFQHFFRRDD